MKIYYKTGHESFEYSERLIKLVLILEMFSILHFETNLMFDGLTLFRFQFCVT